MMSGPLPGYDERGLDREPARQPEPLHSRGVPYGERSQLVCGEGLETLRHRRPPSAPGVLRRRETAYRERSL